MSEATTEITLGEVYRLLKDQAGVLATMAGHLEKRPTWADIERMETARVERESLAAAKVVIQDLAVKDLEDANRWMVRTVAGTLITALVAVAGVAMNAAKVGGL